MGFAHSAIKVSISSQFLCDIYIIYFYIEAQSKRKTITVNKVIHLLSLTFLEGRTFSTS